MENIAFTGLYCLICGLLLQLSSHPPTVVVIFHQNHTEKLNHRLKKCRKCNRLYHYSHYTVPHETFLGFPAKYFYDDTLEKKYFLTTSCTGFTLEFMQTYTSEIFLIPEMSFYGKSNSFNLSVETGNIALEPKRLADSFFLFSLLSMLKFYHKPIHELKFASDVDAIITFYLNHIKSGFVELSCKHRCGTPGCGTCVGWDADCKASF